MDYDNGLPPEGTDISDDRVGSVAFDTGADRADDTPHTGGIAFDTAGDNIDQANLIAGIAYDVEDSGDMPLTLQVICDDESEAWEVVSFPEWVWPDTLSGIGNGTIDIIVYRNTGHERTGEIVVQTADGMAKAVHTVTQEAGADSYYIDTNGVIHGFSMADTPLENFYGNGNITINGNSVARNTVAQIIFGSSYQEVTSIGAGFINGCKSLIHIDLNAFKNVVSIDNAFLDSCTSLRYVDLTGFTKLETIGVSFLFGCNKLQSVDFSGFTSLKSISTHMMRGCLLLSSIYIGSIDWSKISVSSSYLMDAVPDVPTSTLYADTQDLAAKFKTAMRGHISQWGVVISGIHLTPQAVEDITAGGTTFMVNLASLLPWFTDGYSDIGGLHPGLPDWVELTAISGDGGTADIGVTVAANTSGPRYAYIHFSDGKSGKSLLITQAG
jgi:hypothetical protein